MRLNIRPLWTPPLKYSALQLGEYFIPKNESVVYQKTAAAGWRPMATRVATGVAKYVCDSTMVTRMSPSEVVKGDDAVSKIAFMPACCPPPKPVVSFRDLNSGEVFRLKNGEKLMIKMERLGNGDNAVYLHSGDAKCIDLCSEVVRGKVSLNDHGDE